MKKITTLFVATLSATSAAAGSLVYTPPEVAMIDETSTMGGSGSWIVPIIILALLAFAISTDSGNGNGNGNGNENGQR